MTGAIDPERALQALRDIDVPVGARSRVRAKLEAQIDRRAVTPGSARRRWMVGAALAAPVAVVAIVALSSGSDRAITVAGGERYDVQLGSGHVSIRGPAEASVSGDQLSLVQGTVDAQGQLRVKGPACDVVVQGSAEVSVTGAQLTVRVFAGSVEIVPPAFTCEMIDLTSKPITASANRKHAPAISTPTAPEVVTPSPEVGSSPEVVTPPPAHAPRTALPARVAPGRRATPIEASAPIEAPPPPAASTPPTPPTSIEAPAPPTGDAAPSRAEAPHSDPLADAVAAYHAAVALEANDLTAARKAWLAWRARWAKSPLAQSVDLHLLAVLDKLGRRDEAADLAREFVKRYPRSPRRAEVERLIESGQ